MSLLFRAIWQDETHLPHRLLPDEFANWCRSKGLEEIDIPHRGAFAGPRGVVDVRRGDTESGQVYRASLTEIKRDGTWVTTATGISTSDFRGYWIDVEYEGDAQKFTHIAAPRLVRSILTEDGSPHRGPVPMSVDHHFVDAETSVGFLELALNPARDVPLIVFSPDERAGTTIRDTVEKNRERAQLAAQRVAGVAAVYLLSPSGRDSFNAALPDGLKVYGGAVRVYAPNLRLTDDPYQHRYWSLYSHRAHPGRAGELVARHLSRSQHLIEVPAAWAAVRALVTRPTEAESLERRKQLEKVLSPRDHATSKEHAYEDVLMGLLIEAERERDQALQELTTTSSRLQARVTELEETHVADAAELEDRLSENRALRQNIKLLVSGEPVEKDSESPSIDELDVPTSSADVVLMVREHLDLVELHRDAPQDIDQIDEDLKDRVWAGTAWDGFCALQRYAEAVRATDDASGFFIWCKNTGAWSTNKLAMVESRQTLSGDLGAHRVLPVSLDVDPSGTMTMEAHLKIQVGGRGTIPRIYFHDDTRGSTGKIHVGFFGPHYLMPNTKTN